jgi:S1-C subfamily serine protease
VELPHVKIGDSMKIRYRLKNILGFLSMVFLAVGIALGVLLVQSQQFFRQMAADSPKTSERIAEIAKEIGESTNPYITSYASESLGYKFDYNKNYWTITNGNLLDPDLQKLKFVLNSEAGIAEVEFEVFANTDNSSLDRLSIKVSQGKHVQLTEKVRRQGTDYYKLTVETTFLDQKSTYYEYLTVSGDNYYVITAKYPKFGEGELLVERLIDSFSFSAGLPSVQGISVRAATSTVLDETKIVELTKPSVVQIAHLFCNDINIKNTSGLKYLKSYYRFCDGAMGSGFIINKDGFIATNGHVVKQYPDSSLVQTLLTDNPFSQPFFNDLVREISLIQLGQDISAGEAINLLKQAKSDPSYFESFVTLIYKMIQQDVLTISPSGEKHYVKLANDPLAIDQEKIYSDFLNAVTPSSTIKEAEIVGFDYPNPLSIQTVLNNQKETGSDVAVIKIVSPEGLVFPSLTMGTSDGLKEGSGVIVIGYPGLVSGNNPASIVNVNSSATPTITKGIISAIKTDQGGLKLIQVDASIDHGNSGGPALNNLGEVIGIATYGIGSTSGNYNFLRDIEDLKKLAGQNSIALGPSPSYVEWSSGLEYFWREHYRQAVLPFDNVRASYPIHPLATSYVESSQTAIEMGQDKSNILFLLANDIKSQITFFGTLILLAIIIMFVKTRKRRAPPISPGLYIPTQNNLNTPNI